MTTDSPMPTRPLDSKAAAAADTALYDAHRPDPRPNALHDAAGRKRPLSATDPSQQCLRDEWVERYAKSGGKVEEPKPANAKRPGSALLSCPGNKATPLPVVVEEATLAVTLRYSPLPAPVEGVKVTVAGPVTRALVSDAAGKAEFAGLPPGAYKVSAVYDKRNPLVDAAMSELNSVAWSRGVERGPYKEGKYKCNLFVHEMLDRCAYIAPMKFHKSVFGDDGMLPINAGDWADGTQSIDGSTLVSTPEPGDIVAFAHGTWNASGHVGIVAYPKPPEDQWTALAPGEKGRVGMTLKRQTLSATEDRVTLDLTTFWHFYDENDQEKIANIVFRRPGNASIAPVEVKLPVEFRLPGSHDQE